MIERVKERLRERREREWKRGRLTERERDRDRETERLRQTERDIERETQRNRERVWGQVKITGYKE